MKWSACGKPTAGAAGLPESGPDPLVLGRHAPLRERLDEVTRGFGQSVGERDLYKIIGQEEAGAAGQPSTRTSSTWKTRVWLGPMRGGAPRAP